MVGADKTALEAKSKVAGYVWFTTDDGKFYIDWDNNGTLMRSVLNAGHADSATNDSNGNKITSTYVTYKFLNDSLNGQNDSINSKAPKKHLSSDTIYGVCDQSLYGHVKVGSNISVTNGVISLSKSNVTTALGYTPPTKNTTYTFATGYNNGEIRVTSSEGTEQAISVHGLGSAAYKDASGSWDISITGSANSANTANTADNLSRTLGVNKGGTGASTSPKAGGIMYADTPYSYASTNAGTAGQYLKSNGKEAPTWATITPADIGAAAASHGTHVTSDTVKSALGTGSGTSKYLREDGTWVVPPNTDKKVTQSRSSASNYRPLLMHYSNGDYGTDVGSATNSVYYNETIAAKPSTGELKATSFVGSGASLTSLNATHISSGTIAADRLPTSGVTAGTYGPSAAVTGNNNATMNVPEITVDSYGRVTKITNRVYTAKNSTYTSLKNPNALTVYGGSTKSFDYDGSAAKTLTIKAGSNITVTGDTSGNITIANSYSYSLPTATYNVKGGVKPAYTSTNAAKLTTTAATNTTTPTIAAKTTTSGRYYAVEADKNGVLFVNVPWSNTNTTYSAGTGLSLSGTTFSVSTVPVGNGGTGATDKSGARTNLGITSGPSLPSSGSPGDIFFLL